MGGSMTPLAIISFARSHWKLLGIGLLAIFAGIQTLRLSWTQTALEKCHHESDNFTFSVEAKTQAEVGRQKGIADVADTKHKAEAPAIRAATDRFIADNRVRGESESSNPTAADNAAGVPEDVPSNSLVAVSGRDVHACSEATKYAVDAHDWAMKLAGGVE